MCPQRKTPAQHSKQRNALGLLPSSGSPNGPLRVGIPSWAEVAPHRVCLAPTSSQQRCRKVKSKGARDHMRLSVISPVIRQPVCESLAGL